MTGLNKEIKPKELLKEIDFGLLIQLLDSQEFNEQEFYKAVQAKDLDLAIKAYEELENKKNNALVQVL
jgi:hypothetical protein